MSFGKTIAALRELGVPIGLGRLSLKRIYKLDVFEIRKAVQAAGKRRIEDKPVWDALLYRWSLLRSEFKPLDLALTADALAKVRRRDTTFINYLLEEVRVKSHSFVPRDTALLLNALAKLGYRDELLSRALLPALLRRLSEKTRREDLALLALACARLGDPGREAVGDRIVSVLMPRIHSVTDGHTLSILACAFARPRRDVSSDLDGPVPALFANAPEEDQSLVDDLEVGSEEDDGWFSGTESAAARGEIAHLAFVEVLLQQCDQHLWTFRSTDILHLCLAVGSLERAGHSRILPLKLLRRIAKRLQQVYFEFQPGQLVQLLQVLAQIPELDKLCANRALDEVAYVARSLTAKSCTAVLQAAQRTGGHPKAQSAIAWRITREDVRMEFAVPQLCEVVELLAEIRPRRWEHREALLALLQGMQERRREPEPASLARLLRAYGEMSVRDTHWFHISSRLGKPPFANQGVRSTEEDSSMLMISPPNVFPSTDSMVDALVGLARLNMPQLIEAGSLFTHASTAVRDPVQAAKVLEAAAILDLTERRPQDLKPRCLKPLVSVLSSESFADTMEHTDSDDDRVQNQMATLPLRLFPFTDVAVGVCTPTVLEDLRRTYSVHAEAGVFSHDEPRHHGSAISENYFYTAVESELRNWPGIGLVSAVNVGPLTAPWAASLEGLASFLKRRPLRAPQSAADKIVASRRQRVAAGRQAKSEDNATPVEASVDSEAPSAAESGEQAETRGRRRRRERARLVNTRDKDEDTDDEEDWLHDPPAESTRPSLQEATPQTHVLFELLKEQDYYHASPNIRSDRQRAMGQVLRAERAAEVQLLRQKGWLVCCVPEHRWSFANYDAEDNEGLDGEDVASQANQGANLILDTADTVSPNGTMWDLELNDHRSFYIHPSVRTCKFIEMPVGILRPNWLEHATPMGESTVSGRRVFGWTKDDFIDYYADAEACTPVMWYFHGMKTSFYTLSFSEGEAAPEASYFKPPAYCPNATNRSNTAALIV